MVKRDRARNDSGPGEIAAISPGSGEHGCNRNQSFGLWYLTARTAIGKRARARAERKSLFPKQTDTRTIENRNRITRALTSPGHRFDGGIGKEKQSVI